MTESSAEPGTATGGALDRRRLGVSSITLMIIAASAPLTVIAGGVPTSLAVSGSLGVPFGYIVLAVILLVFAVGYAAMSRFVTNAGAFYAYIAQGISRIAGVGSSLVALVCYNAMQVGIFALFGFTISDWLGTRFGITTPWWLWVGLGIIAVGILGVNRVDLSAKVLGVLVALEFVAVIVFDVVSFVAQPEGVTIAPLAPSSLFAPGIGVVLAFGVAAFMGFESAAIYAEEAKDPARTIPRATYLAVVVAGVFYALSSWAMIVGVGPSAAVAQSQELGPGLLFAFLGEHVGVVVTDIVHILFITSLFAALQSFHNAVARYFFSLGREGVLPRWLGSVRASSHAPWAGSVTQTVIAIVVTLGFVIAGASSDDPLFPVLTMFTWLTNTGAMGLVLLMAIVGIAVIGFFRRDARGVSVWVRLVAPVVGTVLLTVLLVLILANFDMMLGQEESNLLTWVLPAIVVLPGVAGMIWAVVLRRRDPATYARIGHSVEDPDRVA
ncbi:APC family permease [Pseudoclavibacter chungangensis]|uniref:APC family permease n=1 Tax=Pseudoclavibacter chungangensis TaxID=587635 RepID=A0A7J5C2X1_9MICO|nr:APC family permease [Pseudoclavibacter chungangensis]KAB1662177.1 APC family permease [Pseudoclavibacter chungangensis]NYJ65367.1 amino acid transporter [Pseudoclavibacter chungangensis]